jgi:hypothetical protein
LRSQGCQTCWASRTRRRTLVEPPFAPATILPPALGRAGTTPTPRKWDRPDHLSSPSFIAVRLTLRISCEGRAPSYRRGLRQLHPLVRPLRRLAQKPFDRETCVHRDLPQARRKHLGLRGREQWSPFVRMRKSPPPSGAHRASSSLCHLADLDRKSKRMTLFGLPDR